MGNCCPNSQPLEEPSRRSTAVEPLPTMTHTRSKMTDNEVKQLLESNLNLDPQKKFSTSQNIAFKEFQSFKEVSDIRQFYKFNKQLGSGMFGTVHLAKHKALDVDCAIKKIDKSTIKDKTSQKMMLNELKVLGETDHPNIVRVYQLLEDKNFYYVAMELITGGDLLHKIDNMTNISQKVMNTKQRFQEKNARHIILQVVQALNYMHKQNIVHRDLKPENIMCQNDDSLTVKLTDFGFACHIDHSKQQRLMCGSPIYMAPEVIQKKNYDSSVDIWSLGILTHVLLCGKPPFIGKKNREQLFESIKNDEPVYSTKVWKKISQDAQDFTKMCLHKNPNKRPTTEQLLESNWLKKEHQDAFEFIDDEVELDVIANISQFRNLNSFQRAILSFISNLKTNSQEIVEITSVFKAMDKDNDGYLSYDEIQACIENKIGHSDTDFTSILAAMDTQKDGKVSYQEFIAAASNKNTILNDQTLERVFKLIDTENNGFIEIDNLMEFFSATGQDIDWHKFIMKVDIDGDGKISKQEFNDAMMQAAKDLNKNL